MGGGTPDSGGTGLCLCGSGLGIGSFLWGGVDLWVLESGPGTGFSLWGCVILSFCWAGASGVVGGAAL